MRDLGQKECKFVEMAFTKLHEHGARPLVTEKFRNVFPVGVMQSDVDIFPVLPKLGQSNIIGRFVVALLAVALDAHRLIVPVGVAALLGLWNDMVTIHEDGAALVCHTEEVNVQAATLVSPRQNLVAFTTTTNALAAVDSEGLEVGDGEAAFANLDGAPFGSAEALCEALLEGKSCDHFHRRPSPVSFMVSFQASQSKSSSGMSSAMRRAV